MADSVVKVAVTGLGVSKQYLPKYKAAPETELVLVHDIDEERARETAELFEVPRWTTDFDEVLSSGVDALDVSTPNQLHAPQTVAALEAGISVLCQKPMAPTVADCLSMCQAAERSEARLAMFMTRRDNPYSDDLRRIVSEGYLGKIAAVRVRAAHRGPFGQKDKDHWRAKASNIGGGSMMQLTVHPLNYALWMLGEGVARVTGFAKNLYCQHSLEGEDVVAAAAELESGTLMTMEAGYSSTGHAMEFYGTEGSLLWGRDDGLTVMLQKDFEGELIQYEVGDAPEAPLRIDPRAASDAADAISAERNGQRTFARALLSGGEFDTSGETGMRDVAICQAVYRSSDEGRPVEVAEMLAEAGA